MTCSCLSVRKNAQGDVSCTLSIVLLPLYGFLSVPTFWYDCVLKVHVRSWIETTMYLIGSELMFLAHFLPFADLRGQQQKSFDFWIFSPSVNPYVPLVHSFNYCLNFGSEFT
jgi:hypothetical protein